MVPSHLTRDAGTASLPMARETAAAARAPAAVNGGSARHASRVRSPKRIYEMVCRVKVTDVFAGFVMFTQQPT